jgi:hypothetical protein
MNDQQLDYLYEDGRAGYSQRLSELYPPEDAYRKTEDILMEEWLRDFYLGKVKTEVISDWCTRHQMSKCTEI